MILNDKVIRSALIEKLEGQAIKPKAIVEELRVSNGNAIADVVALYSEAHCFEIKGCTDKIERILIQGAHYNKVFRKITLVTTENHIQKALSFAPESWGVILASLSGDRVCLNYIRKTRRNPGFDKELAVMTLWKSEMLTLVEGEKHNRKPRDFLAHLISKTKRKSELSINICDRLIRRHEEAAFK